MLLCDLLFGIDGVLPHGCGDAEITSVVSDSRRAVPGSLFIALLGSRTDGHLYLAEAAARGAAAAVVQRDIPSPPLPVVVVPDTRLAAAHIWNRAMGDPTRHMRTVAVTGTNGKTSTSYFLSEILREAGYKVGLLGTLGCLIGESEYDLGGGGESVDIPAAMTTPDPEFLYGAAAEMVRRGTDFLILEASSHALAQRKLDAMQIDLALFTNLTPEHLDFHGTMEQYLRAKAHLFTLSRRGVIHIGDAWAERLTELAPDCAITRCLSEARSDRDADCRALRQELHGMDGVSYLYYGRDAVFPIRCPVPGRFTVANTLLAASAALRLGVDPITVQDALSKASGVPGRMERVLLPDAPFSVWIDYAHTPAALEALLRTVRGARRPGQRITLLFGCGGDRDATKRPAMGRLASALADFVILTSDNSRQEDPSAILRDILRGIDREKPHTVILSRQEAIAYAVREARAGDILLLCGKGHEKYEITRDGKHPFDEAALVRAAYLQRPFPH